MEQKKITYISLQHNELLDLQKLLDYGFAKNIEIMRRDKSTAFWRLDMTSNLIDMLLKQMFPETHSIAEMTKRFRDKQIAQLKKEAEQW